MSLHLALIVSVIIQFVTAVIALTLIRKTRNNIAWWLISFALVLMAIRRVIELFNVFAPGGDYGQINLLNSWIGIAISVVMLISLAYIKRIFNILERFEELKKQNEARVFSAILRTEEEQKMKFSKELHDGLGPLLSAIKMSLSGIKPDEATEGNEKILKNAELLIDESIYTIKEISNNLSPHILNKFGLQKAVKSFIQKLPRDNTPDISFNTNLEEERFSYNIETIVYRIVCELITNTLKHAEASNIFLDLYVEDRVLKIKYMDDGKGFEYEENLAQNLGLGLTNIQSRIKSVRGTSRIYSRPGEGFNMEIEIKTS